MTDEPDRASTGQRIHALVVWALLVGGWMGVNHWLVPQVGDMYDSVNVSLPSCTERIFAFADRCVRWWPAVLGLYVGGGWMIASVRSAQTLKGFVWGSVLIEAVVAVTYVHGLLVMPFSGIMYGIKG